MRTVRRMGCSIYQEQLWTDCAIFLTPPCADLSLCLPALPVCPSVLCHAVTTYATKPGHNFTFATVAGAGHMVPTHKPPQALALLKRFLANEPL